MDQAKTLIWVEGQIRENGVAMAGKDVGAVLSAIGDPELKRMGTLSEAAPGAAPSAFSRTEPS